MARSKFNKNEKNNFKVDGQMLSAKDIEAYADSVRNLTKSFNELANAQAGATEKQKELIRYQKSGIQNSERVTKVWREQQKSAYTQLGDNFNFNSEQFLNKMNSKKSKPQVTSISDWYNIRTNIKQKEAADKKLLEISTKYYNQYSNGGKNAVTGRKLEEMNKAIETEAAEEIAKSAGDFGKASTLIDIASKTFSKAVSVWVGVAQKGYENQSNAYEETFTNISVRTGLTRSQYYDKQWHTNNDLSALGLRDNVGTSEVQQMWNSLASIGADQEMMFERAIDNVVTGKIVPFLDVTSLNVNQLNERLDGRFIKDIRGINLVSSELGVNNYVTQDLIQTLIDQVQPMSDKALEDLVHGSSELTGLLNYLMSEDGGSLSKDQAMSIATTVLKTRDYGAQMLSSGTTTEKMLMTNIIGKNYNPNNISDWNEIAAEYLGILQFADNMGPGYGSAMDSLTMGIIGQSFGNSYSDMMIGNKTNEAGVDIATLIKNTNLSASQILEYANKKTNEYSSGKNQTNRKLQDITVENLMNELSVMNDYMGHWTDIIVTAIKGISTALIGSVIGKSLGVLGGSAGGGAGAGLLAAGGGVLLGALAGTAIVGIANAVSSQNVTKNQGVANKELYDQGSELYGNTAATTVLGASYTTNAVDWENGSGIGNFFKTVGGGIGSGWRSISQLWSDNSTDNKKNYDNLMDSINMSDNSMDVTSRAERALAWMLLADYGNGTSVLSDIGVTHDDFIAYLQSANSPSVYASLKHVGKKGFYAYQPKDSSGNRVEKLSDTYLTSLQEEVGDNFHRYGLAEVPYDNYLASLHEGEAILTASTANELRGLLDEYRNANNQAVSFDAIIQTQTTALVTKLDEVISTIKTNGVSGVITGSPSQANATYKLNNSMLHMTSTKQL